MKTHCYTVYNWLYIQSVPDNTIIGCIQIERIESVRYHDASQTRILTHNKSSFYVSQSPVEIASLIVNHVREPVRDGHHLRATPAESRLSRLELLAHRVARLNPDAGEIGDGMLRTLVTDARRALES